MSESKSLQIVSPQVDITLAVEAFKSFNKLCEEVLTEQDVDMIKGNRYLNKKAWKKLAMIFDLTSEIIESEFLTFDSGVKAVRYRVRVIARNGRYADAEGIVTSNEQWSKGKNLSAMCGFSQTRALNRAIATLIAPNEVSAEEMTEAKEEYPKERASFSVYIKRFNACGIDLNKAKAYIQKEHGIPFSKAQDWQLEEVVHHFSPDILEAI